MNHTGDLDLISGVGIFAPAALGRLTLQSLGRRNHAGQIANLFRKAARQARCTETSARYALESLRAKHFRTVSSLDLIDSAVSLALIHERSTYGCIYIALALTSGCEFVTADERLANAVAARLPVKWLGAI